MKYAFSTILVIALLVALGAMAVMARPNASSAPAAAVLAAPGAQSAAAPDATNKWNAIAMALDSIGTIPNAQALADAIPGSTLLLRWDASIQNFEFYVPGGGGGTNFALNVGEAYFVQLGTTAGNVFSLVGNVPPQSGQPGAVQFNLVGGSPCKWNHISLPLDKGSIVNAQGLADAIGGVAQVLVWDATIQNFDYYVPNGGGGTNFATKIGYPYWVCMNVGKTWPLN